MGNKFELDNAEAICEHLNNSGIKARVTNIRSYGFSYGPKWKTGEVIAPVSNRELHRIAVRLGLVHQHFHMNPSMSDRLRQIEYNYRGM